MTGERVTDDEFRALLDLYMVSDPWPLSEAADGHVHQLLDDEADARGFGGWVEAYHEHEPTEGSA